jgi:ABC-type uncharacterized transport system fused permease/ATPase subunit
MRTTLVSQGSSLIAPVVPLLLCAPKFLDGSMTLGQVMQARWKTPTPICRRRRPKIPWR